MSRFHTASVNGSSPKEQAIRAATLRERFSSIHTRDNRIEAMLMHRSGGDDKWLSLCGAWPTYGHGQKTHFHPRLVPGRRWMQMVAGDPRTHTNHIFLVDVSDVDDTKGVPDLAATARL